MPPHHPHPRTLFRAALAERIAAHGCHLARNGNPDSLPALVLRSGAEDIAESSYPLAGDRGFLRRCYRLHIDALVASGEAAEDGLDALAATVEAALPEVNLPGFETASLRLLQSGEPVVGPEATYCRLMVQIRYLTAHDPSY